MVTRYVDFHSRVDKEKWCLVCPNIDSHKNGNTEDVNCPCLCDNGRVIPVSTTLYMVDEDYYCNREMRIAVASQTSCVLLQDEDLGKWGIGLRRSNKDMTYDITYAYMLVQKWLPVDILLTLRSKREYVEKSLTPEKFERLRDTVFEQCENTIGSLDTIKEKWI